MNHTWNYLAGTALCLSLAGPLPASAEEYRATVVAGLPPSVLFVRMMPTVFLPSIQTALQARGDSISFDEQYGGAIASNGQEIEVISNGLAELGYCIAALRASQLPLQNLTYYTPFVSSEVRVISEVMNRLQFENAEMNAAWGENNLVYLGGAIGIDDYVLMTNFPINSMADLKGAKIAAPGAALNWLSGTGAVAVAGNLSTYYNEVNTGVYQGVVVSPSLAAPMRLHEVAPHITVMRLGVNYIGGLCANRDWYDGLPAEVQQILHTSADETQEWYTAQVEAAYQSGLDLMKSQGATIVQAPEEMRQEWAKGMDNAARGWAQTLDAQGVSGTASLRTYMDAMRAAGAVPVRNWDQE